MTEKPPQPISKVKPAKPPGAPVAPMGLSTAYPPVRDQFSPGGLQDDLFGKSGKMARLQAVARMTGNYKI